jgi:hypothetical protein
MRGVAALMVVILACAGARAAAASPCVEMPCCQGSALTVDALEPAMPDCCAMDVADTHATLPLGETRGVEVGLAAADPPLAAPPAPAPAAAVAPAPAPPPRLYARHRVRLL